MKSEFVSTRLSAGEYLIQTIHPIAVKIKQIEVPSKRKTKKVWVVAKEVGGTWMMATGKPFDSKSKCQRAAEHFLNYLVNEAAFERASGNQTKSLADVISRLSRKDAYEILGIPEGSGEAEIKSAHKRLMIANHPDKGGSNFLMVQINLARETLLGR